MHFLSRTGVAASALLLVSTLALGADAVGPEFGQTKFRASINHPSFTEDVDVYVANVSAGESFTVTVVATGKGNELRPILELFGPDRRPVDLTGFTKVKGKGKAFQIKKFVADESGRWSVRVRGAAGEDEQLTRGDYQVSFKIGKAAAFDSGNQTIGGSDPATRTHAFEAVEGAQIKLTLVGRKKAAVQLTSIKDPAGDEATSVGLTTVVGDAVVKKTKTTIKGVPLHTGSGEYTAEVSLAEGSGKYKLKIATTPPESRPASKKPITLSDAGDVIVKAIDEPIPVAPGKSVTIEGLNFDAIGPTVLFGNTEATGVDTAANRQSLTCIAPDAPEGIILPVSVVNSDGQAATVDGYFFFPLSATLESVEFIEGESLFGGQVPLAGGQLMRVHGSNFRDDDVVEFDGSVIVPEARTPTTMDIRLPANPGGMASLKLTDFLEREFELIDVVHYVGFADVTAVRSPRQSFPDKPDGPTTEEDDLTAYRAFLGDLDADGRRDDLVMSSYNQFARVDGKTVFDPTFGRFLPIPNKPGTREVHTRMFHHTGFGHFDDVTDTKFPSYEENVRDFNARVATLGDLDNDLRPELILGGTYAPGATDPYYPNDFERILLVTNNGSGTFTVDTLTLPGFAYEAPVTAYHPDPNPDAEEPNLAISIKSETIIPLHLTAMVVGDIDGDLDNDLIAAFPRHGERLIENDPAYVDYNQNPPYIAPEDVNFLGIQNFYPAIRILENDDVPGGGTLIDATATRFPSAGSASEDPKLSYPARDLALGDIDGDDDLDLITTFNNPASMTPYDADLSYGYLRYGRYYYEFDEASTLRTATRVLLNDGDGVFTDATDDWMPAPTAPDYWQGHVVRLADLDNDDDLDLVILHERSLNEFQDEFPSHTRYALRILRQTEEDGFEDVTAAALPPLVPGSDETYRGGTMAIHDINEDGFLDIVIATRDVLEDENDQTIPSTRLLFGGEGLRFTVANSFLPTGGVLTDTGEADQVLLGDLDGDRGLSLLLIGEITPATSPGGEALRIFDWRDGDDNDDE